MSAWDNPAAYLSGPFCAKCEAQATAYRLDVVNGDAYRRVCFCREHLPADDGHTYWPLDRTGLR